MKNKDDNKEWKAGYGDGLEDGRHWGYNQRSRESDLVNSIPKELLIEALQIAIATTYQYEDVEKASLLERKVKYLSE